jgi:hypothetical protein
MRKEPYDSAVSVLSESCKMADWNLLPIFSPELASAGQV